MPRALAIETSGRVGSVAVAIDGTATREVQFEHGLQNAAKILPIIDQLCRAQGWTPRDIDEVCVSVGPGSFTGLRVGVTIAKTIGLASGARVVAVPTVRVLAMNAPPDATTLIIVLDAKRGQIFAARMQRRGDDWRQIEPAHLDTLATMLSRAARPVHLLGEGIPFHENEFDREDPSILVTSHELWRARASSVARIGHEMARRNEFADPDRLTPVYIRLPEAEEKWRARQREGRA
jgi:tRNA threonylcarbamoyladenosine biosynthesis protein TsaB